jgi:hypothetical protein
MFDDIDERFAGYRARVALIVIVATFPMVTLASWPDSAIAEGIDINSALPFFHAKILSSVFTFPSGK